jgi:hypothetical protein
VNTLHGSHDTPFLSRSFKVGRLFHVLGDFVISQDAVDEGGLDISIETER